MRGWRIVGVVVAVVVIVAGVVFALSAGSDDETPESDGATSTTTSTSSATAPSDLPTSADEDWCSGWDQLVATQGQYVASPTPDAADAVLAAVDALQALGVPASLDPGGYTELTAVLDDVRGSVDPSFTPSIVPSEPADVESDNAAQAPFGAWLAQYCPR